MILYGLSKTFYLKPNALSNLQLIGMALKKIFYMDDKPYQEEIL